MARCQDRNDFNAQYPNTFECSDLLAQYSLLYYINALFILQNIPIYIHDIQIL